jgi:hypothetical protein
MRFVSSTARTSRSATARTTAAPRPRNGLVARLAPSDPMTTPGESAPANEAELTRLCATDEAAYQRAAHHGLGRRWIKGEGVAWAPDGPAHRFLFGAVTLERRPTLPDALRGRVCDSFGALRAADLPGPGWRSVRWR